MVMGMGGQVGLAGIQQDLGLGGLAFAGQQQGEMTAKGPSPSKAPRWTPWRELLKRSFGVDGWACPHCGQRMRLRAVVLPPATLKILRGLQAACRAPPGADALAG